MANQSLIKTVPISSAIMWPCIIIVLTLINSVVESGLVTSYSPKELVHVIIRPLNFSSVLKFVFVCIQAAENVGYQVKFQKDWFNLSLLGEAKQVSGIAANFTQPTIGIFHRSTAVWDQKCDMIRRMPSLITNNLS